MFDCHQIGAVVTLFSHVEHERLICWWWTGTLFVLRTLLRHGFLAALNLSAAARRCSSVMFDVRGGVILIHDAGSLA